METLSIVEIAYLIIMASTLICFFFLCYNVGVITRKIKNDDKTLKYEFERNLTFGNIGEAENILKKWYWIKIDEVRNEYHVTEKIKEINHSFKHRFDIVNLNIPSTIIFDEGLRKEFNKQLEES